MVFVITRENVDTGTRVPDNVVGNYDVLERAPGRVPALIANCQHNCGCQYLALDQVAVDQNAPGIFEFKSSLDGCATNPLLWLTKKVAANLNITGNQTRN